MATDRRRTPRPFPTVAAASGPPASASRLRTPTESHPALGEVLRGPFRRLQDGELDAGAYAQAIVDGALRHLGDLATDDRAFVRAALVAALDESEHAGALYVRIVRATP